MSRTDLDAATLARSLRRMAGDGGMEWCCEPIRASVLLDVADLLDEDAKLRELCVKALEWLRWAGGITCPPEVPDEFADELRELGVD